LTRICACGSLSTKDKSTPIRRSRLLRTRGERPCGRSGAEQQEEVAAPQLNVHPPSRELHPAYIENRNSHSAAVKDDAMWGPVTTGMVISKEETFGPVAPLCR